MAFPRYTESQLRDLIRLLDLPEADDTQAVAKRLHQLRRGLAPEDEFSLLLNWLGRCRLIHKLGQEQLPIESTEEYRVPDFLVVFEREGALMPALIEVKSTGASAAGSLDARSLSLKPAYMRYAELLNLPMLVAWHHESFWNLFDMRIATLAEKNYRVTFDEAMRNNLLGILAGDFAYGVVSGTALVLNLKRLDDKPAADGGMSVQIEDSYFTNADGERLNDIPELMWLLVAWEHEEIEQQTDDGFLLKVVVDARYTSEYASRTFRDLAHSFAHQDEDDVNWRALTHDSTQFAHRRGRFREVVSECLKLGVVSHIFDIVPASVPDFLRQRSRQNYTRDGE